MTFALGILWTVFLTVFVIAGIIAIVSVGAAVVILIFYLLDRFGDGLLK